MINIKILNIERTIENSSLEDIFQVDLKKQEWIWANRDIFFDIVYNTLEYDSVDEEELKEEIKSISDDVFAKILKSKFKEIGWIQVDQRLFEKLVEDFISTKDMETFIYISRKIYAKKIIAKTNKLSWMLKAMAVDAYRHLALKEKTLLKVFEEYFNENSMIIEQILLTGEYKLNVATWKLDKKSNLLEFYKIEERHSQWSEENSSFVFYELSK